MKVGWIVGSIPEFNNVEVFILDCLVTVFCWGFWEGERIFNFARFAREGIGDNMWEGRVFRVFGMV